MPTPTVRAAVSLEAEPLTCACSRLQGETECRVYDLICQPLLCYDRDRQQAYLTPTWSPCQSFLCIDHAESNFVRSLRSVNPQFVRFL